MPDASPFFYCSKDVYLAVLMMLLGIGFSTAQRPDYPMYDWLLDWGVKTTTRNPEEVSKLIPYMGYNFAGASEFPWVVDIRPIEDEFNYKEQSDFGVGNLISSRYVLTGCSVVADYRFLVPKLVPIMIVKNKDKYKVMFAPTFLYAKDSPLRLGTRYIHRMSPHPDCDLVYLMGYHYGIIELERAVIPSPPFVSYLPIHYDPIEVNHWIYRTNDFHWIQCAIGSWGRAYNLNDKNKFVPNMLTNYKVKYQVRIAPVNYCRKVFQTYCHPKDDCQFPEQKNINVYAMRCMQVIDEKTAHVCHHDRGAAVVCRSTTNQESIWTAVGIVSWAAREEHCDPADPKPFLVDTIMAATIYYQNLSPYRYFDKPNLVKT